MQRPHLLVFSIVLEPRVTVHHLSIAVIEQPLHHLERSDIGAL